MNTPGKLPTASWLALAAAGIALISAGCSTVQPSTAAREARFQEELLEADRSFARLALENGAAEAFFAFAAEGAAVFLPGEMPVQGRDAIKVALSAEMPGQLKWEPEEAQVSFNGNMGYTWGLFEYRALPSIHSPARFGKYVTVWKRQPGGSWRFVVNIGNPAPPPRAPNIQ